MRATSTPPTAAMSTRERAEPVQIAYATTEDDEIGAIPPLGDDTWRVVCSGDGRTLWRCIRLNMSSNTCATGALPQDATT